MLTWLKELWTPRKKCERVGHKIYKKRRRGIQYPSSSMRGVADEVEVQYSACSRCHATLSAREDFEVLERSAIHSLTMPDSDWVKLKRDGALWDSYQKEADMQDVRDRNLRLVHVTGAVIMDLTTLLRNPPLTLIVAIVWGIAVGWVMRDAFCASIAIFMVVLVWTFFYG